MTPIETRFLSVREDGPCEQVWTRRDPTGHEPGVVETGPTVPQYRQESGKGGGSNEDEKRSPHLRW